LITIELIQDINNLTLVDSSEGMLNQLKIKLSTLNLKKEIYINTDLFSESIKLDSYDLIYSSMVLHHIKIIDLFGKRFNELLLRNGSLCIIDLFPVNKEYHINEPDFDGYHGFDPDWLSKKLEKLGFEKESCRVIYNDSKEINSKIIDYSLFILLMRKK
jgi:ubiquinone/menaquinone biosynthesis C-methylase UbiE